MVSVVTESVLRRCVALDEGGLAVIEDGFARLGRGEVTIPPIMGLEIPEENGAMDAKAAYVRGWDSFAVKISTRFFNNPKRGLRSAGGMMTLLDSATGNVRAVLLDNGYLTTVRTALAGALAAKYLAPERIDTVGIIGAGNQACWQLRALRLVRDFRRVLVYSRSPERATDYAARMSNELDVEVTAADAEQVIRDSRALVTTTASASPIVMAPWLQSGSHITAMGSDAPHKNELHPEVIARADVLVCDETDQCLTRGELHHAVDAGAVASNLPARTLGDIVNGAASGRQNDRQITICDLTGVGVQDTAIARRALARAAELGLVTELG